MLERVPAEKVTIYVNEDARWHHQPAHQAVLDFLLRHSVRGATAVRAMAGFGARHVLHTPRIEVLAEHLPILIEFVDVPETVEALLPELREMVRDGLIEVQQTSMLTG